MVMNLTTLSFLRQGSLPRTLTELQLSYFQPPVSLAELPHVLKLRALRVLHLHHVFDTPLGIGGELLFKPPIQPVYMPDLNEFKHSWEVPEEEELGEGVEDEED